MTAPFIGLELSRLVDGFYALAVRDLRLVFFLTAANRTKVRQRAAKICSG